MFGLCEKACLFLYISKLFKLLLLKLQAKIIYIFILFFKKLCIFCLEGYRCLFLIEFHTHSMVFLLFQIQVLTYVLHL